jgi:hypothetical protein
MPLSGAGLRSWLPVRARFGAPDTASAVPLCPDGPRIYPASSYARLIVSAQMVFSFILFAIAIGTALQREIARADR